MDSNTSITIQKQKIARLEKDYALDRLKRRRADTRRKIQLGGLVIKSGIDGLNKSVILGALAHTIELIENDPTYLSLFESIGDNLFLDL